MRAPSIGLTRGLWHDRERYLESYWSRLPGIWVHGDFAVEGASRLSAAWLNAARLNAARRLFKPQ